MAILKSGDLSLDFQYAGFSCGWVDYEFRFLWKGKAIVKDSVFRRDNEWTKNRSKSAFQANEDEEDSFLPILKEVLENNEAVVWCPLEPDVFVDISPKQGAKRKTKEKLKKEPRKLPDDLFTFIVEPDSYRNFKGDGCYNGDGIYLHMTVKRQELERFARDLEREYQEFKAKYKVDEYDEYRDDKREVGPFFKGADLAFAYLRNADLRKIRESTQIKNLAFAYLRNTDLRNANLYGADLRGADLTDGWASPTLHLLKGANLVLAKLEGIYFNGRLESTASINLRLV